MTKLLYLASASGPAVQINDCSYDLVKNVTARKLAISYSMIKKSLEDPSRDELGYTTTHNSVFLALLKLGKGATSSLDLDPEGNELLESMLASIGEGLSCDRTTAAKYLASLGISSESAVRRGQTEPAVLDEFMTWFATMHSWWSCGYPIVQVGHKLCAAFAVTEPYVFEKEDGLPFDSFLLELPNGFLSLPIFGAARGILFSKIESEQGYLHHVSLLGDANVAVTVAGNSSKHLLDSCGAYYSKITPSTLERYADDLEPLEKSIRMAVTVLYNTMAHLANYNEARKPIGQHSHAYYAKYGNKCRHGEPPPSRIYKIMHDVKHDFRESVAAYLAGKRHKLSVQSMVVGHWKMQAHGQQYKLRRRQFIDPYWRGPETAPIAARRHKLE